MVRPAEFEEKKDDAVTSSLFLSSVNSFHKKDGVRVEVAHIGKYFPTPHDASKTSFTVKFNILDEMPKCRARKIGEDGKVVKKEDEITGKVEPQIELISNPEQVTFFFKGKKDKDSDELECPSLSNLFPLLKFAFEQGGMDMTPYQNGFWFDRSELEEYLLGLVFVATVEQREMSGNKYFVLIPQEDR